MDGDGALSKENILAASQRMKAGVEADSSEWKCPQCEKRFAILSEWRRHVESSHVSGKPFRCRRVTCLDWFATRDERARHESQEHGDRPAVPGFWCSHCPTVFPTETARISHEADRHPQVVTGTLNGGDFAALYRQFTEHAAQQAATGEAPIVAGDRHPTRVDVWRQFVTTFPNATVTEWLQAVSLILAPGWE